METRNHLNGAIPTGQISRKLNTIKMKKSILFATFVGLVFFTSCDNFSKKKVKLLEKGPTFSIYTENRSQSLADSISIGKEEFSKGKIISFGNRPPKLIPEKLPDSYTNRKFLKGLAGMTYDIYLVPGNIVKYHEKDSTYELKTLKGIIKNDSLPRAVNIDDGINYSSKINSGASLNGSFLIGGVSVESNKIMELIIQDISKSIVPPDLIDIDRILSAVKNIPINDRKNFFYIKTATLTYINSRKYSETRVDLKINATYVTAEGKAYSTSDKFSRERLVSVDLISLEDLLH